MNPSIHHSLAGGLVGRETIEGLSQELAFSIREYERRLTLIREVMAADGLDMLLVFDPPNVFYLSGFQSFAMYNAECVVVPLDGEPSLIVHPPELGGALMHTWLDRVYGYGPDEDTESFLAKLLTSEGFAQSRIGIEKGSRALSVKFYEVLNENLPQAEFRDCSTLVAQVKAKKSEEEIAHLRRSASITDNGMAAAIAAIKTGRTDNDVAAAAYEEMVGGGSEYMCLGPIVTTGRRSSILHSTHKRIRLESGDTLLIEMGACIQRYTAPTMRSATVGGTSHGGPSCRRSLPDGVK